MTDPNDPLTLSEHIEQECEFGVTLGYTFDDARAVVRDAARLQRGTGLPLDWAVIHQAVIDQAPPQ